MSGFVDLHAHYLAALDDGAPDMDTTVQMVNAVTALGFSELYATPHQRAGLFLPTAQAIAQAFAEMTALLSGAGAPRLGLAAENFWDEVFLERLQAGQIPSYDAGPAFLFEVNPQLMPAGIEGTLFNIRLGGKLPVMAHPERYVAVQTQIERARGLGQSAALLVDLAALDGAHGKAEMRTARQLLRDGLAHGVATDIHAPDDAGAIAAGMAWIRKQLGPATLQTLLADNPRQILAGELPERRA